MGIEMIAMIPVVIYPLPMVDLVTVSVVVVDV